MTNGWFEFGTSDKRKSITTLRRYSVDKEELLSKLDIEGKAKFIQYDFKKGVLTIEVEEVE